ncbi:MAG TPA: nuclear transport factor 2 family protein [Thermoleophilaceae bacterium]|nr:nuclear transport factor 2 family protein [Thermoleophilaceae bacterium]
MADNVELLRQIFAEVGDDPEAFFEYVAEDVEWDLRDTTSPIAGLYHGREEVRDLYRSWAAAFRDWHFRMERLIGAGDEVVAFVTERGHGRGSGVEVEMKRANVMTFRDGKVVRYRSFSSRDDALRAAGIDPQSAP